MSETAERRSGRTNAPRHERRVVFRPDFPVLAHMITSGARVLDIGCGDGDLLHFLQRERNIDGRGMELSQDGVNASVSRGLSVVQGDADTDLVDYPNGAFDVVILSQSLQVLHYPRFVLEQMLRIGSQAIVSFPNFGYWRVRWDLALRGRMPVTSDLPVPWYDTANIHLCTILDFMELCEKMKLNIEQGLTLDRKGNARPIGRAQGRANLFGEQGVFLLEKR
ncbi:MAG: methionine biosynthesis protein MetW [Alphaproteobacteria bacterium]|nr:methionine biosynthesis protein MetW [Alphaproteobacteria bacterium]